MGVALSLKTRRGVDCRTSSVTLESMIFLRKSIQSRLSKGGGLKLQNACRVPPLTSAFAAMALLWPRSEMTHNLDVAQLSESQLNGIGCEVAGDVRGRVRMECRTGP